MPSVNCDLRHSRGRGYLSHSMHLRNNKSDGMQIPFRALDFGDDDMHSSHVHDQDDIGTFFIKVTILNNTVVSIV